MSQAGHENRAVRGRFARLGCSRRPSGPANHQEKLAMTSMTRRDLLRTAARAGAALALPTLSFAADEKLFTLPDLPYKFDALEPHIDARTMEIHHDRHHKAYVDNLNKALMGTDWAGKKIEEILTSLDKL